jgi:hypothetical protein
MAFNLGNMFGSKKSLSPVKSPKKSRKSPSSCTTVAYKECRKKSNPDCEWVYGSIKGQKTKVRKRHCRTRRNTKRA